ncbi:MAG: RNA polymerase sigma factor [Acidobacteria bacterium]|nr:RNA polymerase sigma factor [Acidobacteriota bacterium]
MTPTTPSLESLAARAKDGDREALEALVAAIRHDIYNLAVRMLWHPADAEDATQEILLRIVTKLATFRGDSAFRTWSFRVATNHLLNVRRSRAEREALTFERFGTDLETGLSDPPAGPADDPQQALLVEEVKLGCTTGMLLCLSREERLAYIVGDILDLPSEEAARSLGIRPPAFRKRLSRARDRLRTFMRAHCGLVSPDAACSCRRRVASAIAHGRVDPDRLLFAGVSREDAVATTREVEALHDIADLFRRHPRYSAPDRLVDGVRRVLDSGRFRVLN